MVEHVRSPACIVHADVILTQSNVKVTEPVNFQKLLKIALFYVYLLRHWSAAQNWWLIAIVWDISLQVVGARFSNFLVKSYRMTSKFAERISKGHISALLARVTSSGRQVVLYVFCMLLWPWPYPRSRSTSGQWLQTRSGFFNKFPKNDWKQGQPSKKAGHRRCAWSIISSLAELSYSASRE